MSTWKKVKKPFLMWETSYTSWESKYTFLVGTESNLVSRHRAWEPREVCLMCPVQRGFTAQQQWEPGCSGGWHSLGHEPVATGCCPCASSTLIHGAGLWWLPRVWGSITWVAHLCSYFCIVLPILAIPWGQVLLHVGCGCLYTKGFY